MTAFTRIKAAPYSHADNVHVLVYSYYPNLHDFIIPQFTYMIFIYS